MSKKTPEGSQDGAQIIQFPGTQRQNTGVDAQALFQHHFRDDERPTVDDAYTKGLNTQEVVILLMGGLLEPPKKDDVLETKISDLNRSRIIESGDCVVIGSIGDIERKAMRAIAHRKLGRRRDK